MFPGILSLHAMFKNRRINYILLISFVFLTSCKFTRLQKNGDQDEKYSAAIKYFEEKDYYKANILFEEILPTRKGQAGAEKGLFYNAYTYYYGKQYIMAAHNFRDFYETYPRSEYTEECMFMYAKSLYKDSPEYNLDQTNTQDAMVAIQGFANRYTTSKYMDEINKMAEDLTRKLEIKAFENAKLYYNIGSYNSILYKSAVIAFKNFQHDYPASGFTEEASFLKMDAQYKLATGSYEAIIRNGTKVYLKKDRLYETIEFYHNFIDKYPESKYKKAAELIYESCQDQLKELKS
jgi:outer membrane protein assembly factor BamD